MAQHRSPDRRRPPEVFALRRDGRATRKTRSRGSHRAPPPAAFRGRLTLNALATGAAVSAALSTSPPDDLSTVHVAAESLLGYEHTGSVEDPSLPALPALQPVVFRVDTAIDVQALGKATRLAEQLLSRQRAPAFVRPVNGVITSNYGPRWGTTHYGLDIANSIGTPIRSVSEGVVIDAGPASGFGLWVRVRLGDGSITVYGHINRYLVREGQRVKAGQVIAEVGNRGVSTGPHLHFEVIDPRGRRLDPLAWLTARGAGYG